MADGQGLVTVIPRPAPAGRAALLSRVSVLWKAQRRAEALAEAEAALAQDPEDRPLLLRRCSFLRQLGRAREAVAVLLPLHESEPRDIALTLELAQAHRAAGDIAAALALFDEVLARDPSRHGAWIAKVELLAKAGRPEAAFAAAEEALARMPADRWLRLKRGVLLRDLKQPAAAVAALMPLRHDLPDDLAVMLELGQAHVARGDPAAGQAMFDAVLAADPAHRGAWLAKVEDALLRHDQAALMALARGLHDRLGREADPHASALLARILPQLEIARWGPEVAAWIEAVAALPVQAKPADLWALHGVAQLHGLPVTCRRLLNGLLARPALPLSVALNILRWSDAQRGETGHLKMLLRSRLAAPECPFFDLHAAAMELGPAQAVARRRRQPGRPAREIILLADLLVAAGREALAHRYLSVARRLQPAEASLRRRHLNALTAAGQVEEALRAAEELLAEAASPPDWKVGITALIALGQGERALELMDACSDPEHHRAFRRGRLELALRFGRFDEARALAAESATLGNARRALHFGLTLEGLQLTELRLAELNRAAPTPSSVEGRLIGPSIQALDAHMARLAKRPPRRREGPGRIPRNILQYWNTGKPPPALEAIMHSWQAAEGYAYHLFDRLAALRFLAAELGADWAAALRLANHPAEQSDFFRLCFLAVKGGIYADCDDRLIGSLDELTAGEAGLVVFRERRGAIANNLLLAEPAHPVVIHAAVAAKQALLRKDNDSVWTKTGPGLLTRSVAVACEEAGAREADPGVTIHTMLHAARHVQCHIPLPYKRTAGYWNASSSGAHLAPMAAPEAAELVAANAGPPPMGQA